MPKTRQASLTLLIFAACSIIRTVVSESEPTGPVASKIAASTSTSTVSVSQATGTWGNAYTVTVRVATSDEVPTGKVTIKVGSLTKTPTLNSAGVATITVPKTFRIGKYTVSTTYAGSDTVAPSSGTARLVINKASLALSEKFASAVKKSVRAKGVVTAKVVGTTLKVGGTVKVMKGKTIVGKGKLKRGQVTIRLIKLPKGKNKLVLKLPGTTNTKAASKRFVLKVK